MISLAFLFWLVLHLWSRARRPLAPVVREGSLLPDRHAEIQARALVALFRRPQ